jgi:hypothetical protein
MVIAWSEFTFPFSFFVLFSLPLWLANKQHAVSTDPALHVFFFIIISFCFAVSSTSNAGKSVEKEK